MTIDRLQTFTKELAMLKRQQEYYEKQTETTKRMIEHKEVQIDEQEEQTRSEDISNGHVQV